MSANDDTIQDLKDKFSDGESPSGTDFADLIDSCFNEDQADKVYANLGATETIGFYTDTAEPGPGRYEPIEPQISSFTQDISAAQQSAQVVAGKGAQGKSGTPATVPTSDAVVAYVAETSAKINGDAALPFNAKTLDVADAGLVADTTGLYATKVTTPTLGIGAQGASTDLTNVATSADNYDEGTKDVTLPTMGYVKKEIDAAIPEFPDLPGMPVGSIIKIPRGEVIPSGDWVLLDGSQADTTDWDPDVFLPIVGKTVTLEDLEENISVTTEPAFGMYISSWIKVK